MRADLTGAIKAAIDSNLAKAKRAERRGDKASACERYRLCGRLAREYAESSVSSEAKESWLELAQSYQLLAKRILAARETPPKEPRQLETSQADTPFRGEIENLVYSSPVSWDDIGGLDETKDEIKFAYGIEFVEKPKGVRLEGWRTILLYGPPGTGKTMLAAATSHSLKATFFNVSLSSILSKYFGESAKLISTLYVVAREKAPSVVYMDEFESLAARRGEDESGAERRVVTSLLIELDGLTSKGNTSYVLTMAATNMPWLLDEAILSRFQKRIYVPVPDDSARQSILRLLLDHNGFQLDLPYSDLVSITAGYSGRELGRLCQDVGNKVIKELNPEISRLVDEGPKALSKYKLQLRPLRKEDFETVLAQMKPETTPAQLQRFSDWKGQVG